MDEQHDVIAELGDAGVLAGVRWAYESATRRALESYSEADGHDAAWLGNTRFTLFRDRLDRVFACDRYAASAADGLDLATYIVAHSLDAFSGEIELVLGRPRLNLGGGPAWHWYQDLLTVPLPGAGRRPDVDQVPADPTGVPDAPVRLRRLEGGRSDAAR